MKTTVLIGDIIGAIRDNRLDEADVLLTCVLYNYSDLNAKIICLLQKAQERLTSDPEGTAIVMEDVGYYCRLYEL